MLSKDGCVISIMNVTIQVAYRNTTIFNLYFMMESMDAAMNHCPPLLAQWNHAVRNIAAVQLTPFISSTADFSLVQSHCLIYTCIETTL